MFNKEKTIEEMNGAAFPVIAAPFNGSVVMVQVRCLNHVQLKACGDFSIIDFSKKEDKEKEPNTKQVIEVVNYQEKLLKETLVSPTYEEIVKIYYGSDTWVLDKQKEIKELREKINTDKLSLIEKTELEEEINLLEMKTGYLLPSDFTAFITSWALSIERSDIKKITREMLLDAAILADRGKNNPADHLTGNFNDYHKDQINKAGWIVFGEFQREKEIERAARKKGINIIKPRGK